MSAATCAGTTATWGPNDGCAEFMAEAEEFGCSADATFEVVITEPAFDDGCPTAEMEETVWHLCPAHVPAMFPLGHGMTLKSLRTLA